MTAALCSPNASSTTRLALRIVPTPIVIAFLGTFHSPKKSLDASIRVTRSSVIRRVRESRGEPGSLKPMWPVRPMPRSWKSSPPHALIFRS